MDLLTPSSPGVFQLCIWPLITPGYLGGGLPCLSSAIWCQYSCSTTRYQLTTAHSDCRWTCGCAGKTVRSLENTCRRLPECFWGDDSRRGAIASVRTITFTFTSVIPWCIKSPQNRVTFYYRLIHVFVSRLIAYLRNIKSSCCCQPYFLTSQYYCNFFMFTINISLIINMKKLLL